MPVLSQSTGTFEDPNYGAFSDIALTPGGNMLAGGATNHVHMPLCSDVRRYVGSSQSEASANIGASSTYSSDWWRK
jgi:hypothetical protein